MAKNNVKKIKLVLSGVNSEVKQKFLPSTLALKNEEPIEYELKEYNGLTHVVVPEDSKYYTEGTVADNSIGYISSRIYTDDVSIEDIQDEALLSDEKLKASSKKLSQDVFNNMLEEYENKKVRFLESFRVFLIVELELSGSVLESKMSNVLDENSALSLDDISLRMNHLEKLGITQKMKEKVLENIQKNPKDLRRVPQGGFKYLPQDGEFEMLIAGYLSGANVMLEGAQASGKNTAIEDIGFLFNQPLYELQVNGEINNSDILGVKTIEPIVVMDDRKRKELEEASAKMIKAMNNPELLDQEEYKVASRVVVESLAGGETQVVYEPSPLIEAMENDGIVVLDEINTGHPSIMSILNPILDARKRIDVPGYKVVKATENFKVFATMNNGYAGTMNMNSATHSRFMVVEFHPSPSIREIVKKDFPNVDEQVLVLADKIYQGILSGVNNKNVRITPDAINIRAIKNAISLVEQGVSVSRAFDVIATSSASLHEREAIRTIIMANI